MFSIAMGFLIITMFLALIRALMGPTVYDRILALNAFGTLTVAVIAVYGFLSKRPDFLDIAMVYALINFIATIAAVKYTKFNHLGFPTSDDQRDI